MQDNILMHPYNGLMRDFAKRTGLDPEGPTDRYLWTDSFAVCNYLGQYRNRNDNKDLEIALRLIDQVHSTLGKYSPDDTRSGWLSNLSEEEGLIRPTIGGLRIGKPLLERAADEPYDPDVEWERDGQYYHYLTKWIHALVQAGLVTEDIQYIEQGIELALTIHTAFIHETRHSSRKSLYWKMSVDLSRPLVSSMGRHDALDGYLTYVELDTAGDILQPGRRKQLVAEISELAMICRGTNWETNDPLGVGSLLFNGCRMAQLIRRGALTDASMLSNILRSALPGLEAIRSSNLLEHDAEDRLAFRELGLAIGLRGVSLIRNSLLSQADAYGNAINMRLIQELMQYLPMSDSIESFWALPDNRLSDTWRMHQNINDVMLATCMEPHGLLRFQPYQVP
ncbi:MAG: hypothetical protein GX369_07085 [Euryarchaeota archaeon]|nr:hypothetical protein [Euryarchaeota archaeon]